MAVAWRRQRSLVASFSGMERCSRGSSGSRKMRKVEVFQFYSWTQSQREEASGTPLRVDSCC